MPISIPSTSPASFLLEVATASTSTAVPPIMMTSTPINISMPSSIAENASSSSMSTAQMPNCMIEIFTPDQTSYRLYANLPISVFGILMNILNILVFYDREMRTLLMNHFLMALSISDLLLLIFNFFFLLFPVMAVNSSSFFLHDVFPIVLRYSYPLALTTQTCGVYLTVVVSVHRFLGVCHPFRTKRWVTRKPVHYAIAGCVLFSIVVNIPTWMELGIEPCYSSTFETTSRQIFLTSLQKEPYYHLIKRVILYTAIMFIIPFLMLILVNCQIIGALRRSTKLRKDHTISLHSTKFPESSHEKILKQFRLLKRTKYTEVFQNLSKLSNATIFKPPKDILKRKFTNSTRDRSVTLMLLAIVAIFLGCNGLAFCNNIIEIFIADKMSEEGMLLFDKLVEISNILITVNSSTSTLVYLIFSSKYRKVLKSLVRFKRTTRINRIALTTAVAAHRAVELSLIPDEAASEDRRKDHWQAFGKKLFRRQDTNTKTLALSESFLRLTITDETSIPPLSPKDIKSNRSSRANSRASL